MNITLRQFILGLALVTTVLSGFAKDANTEEPEEGFNVKEMIMHLSLIHISEPTRPY